MLTGPVIIPPRTLQYADDTVLLMEAVPRNTLIVKQILANFASLSGLHINDSKCLFVPVSVPPAAYLTFSSILRCPSHDLPITYLGLPLTFKRYKKIYFKPLIDAVQRRLDGWKARLLSSGGRLTLVKSVLTSLPLHFMQVISLPPWLIKHLDGIRRRFFWKGNDKCLGGHCLVNWKRCCLPKKAGGLGILDLSLQNQALLLRWLWKLKANPDSMWTKTVLSLYSTTDFQTLSNTSSLSCAFKDILQFAPFFSCSRLQLPDNTTLTWRWTATGIYSSSSAYRVLADPGVATLTFHKIWKLRIPPKVKVFIWLLLQDRLLTQQNLIQRNWPSIEACLLCASQTLETSAHLFLHCPFAKRLWDLIQQRFSLHTLLFPVDFICFWTRNSRALQGDWDIIWAASCWTLWKERNNRIFSGASKLHFVLVREILTLVCSWKMSA